MTQELNKLLKSINKQFGENTASFLTEDYRPHVEVYSSGSLTLDLALERGGIPKGRLIEVFGPSMGGKTTLSLIHIAEVQKANEGYCAFIDAEHAFDAKLAKEYGVDLDQLIYINPKNAENAIDAADALIRTGDVRLVVIDSVSALTPSKVVESSIEQQTMGLLARFMGTACQKLNGISYEHQCTVMFINQVREKIGGFSPTGNTPLTTSGGRALPFYSSVRLDVRMADRIKVKDEIIGHVMKIKVVKNKVGIPFKEASFNLIYQQGIDRIDEISQLSIYAGLIKQGGAWFRYETEDGQIFKKDDVEYKWQGREKLTQFLRDTPEFLKRLEDQLRGVDVKAPDTDPVTDQDGY